MRQLQVAFAALALLTGLVRVGMVEYHDHYQSASALHLTTQVPEPDTSADGQLQGVIGCQPDSIKTTPSAHAVDGYTFSCTTSDGGFAQFTYFATQSDAWPWIQAQLAADHEPVTDALIGGLWAVVSKDAGVLAAVRDIGGIVPPDH